MSADPGEIVFNINHSNKTIELNSRKYKMLTLEPLRSLLLSKEKAKHMKQQGFLLDLDIENYHHCKKILSHAMNFQLDTRFLCRIHVLHALLIVSRK